MTNFDKLEEIKTRIGKLSQQLDWKKDWSNGGVYIHLEVSEFIEALRGKGDTCPTSEAGDILVSFFAVLDHYKIPISDVVSAAENNLEKVESLVPEHYVILRPHFNEGSAIYLEGSYHKLNVLLGEIKTSSIGELVGFLKPHGYMETQENLVDKFEKCDKHKIKTVVQCDKYVTQYFGFSENIFETVGSGVKPNGLIAQRKNA